MPILLKEELQQIWSELDDIERSINNLYIDRLVFSAGRVRRLLLALQNLKAKMVALQGTG